MSGRSFKQFAFVAAVATAFGTGLSSAAPVLDGNISAGEYGAGPSASAAFDPLAPESNFQAATPLTRVGYSIYQTSANGYYYGAIQVNTPNPTYGASGIVGTFANLYFDLDPDSATPNGSDLGFELGLGANNQRAFSPGYPGSVTLSGILVAANANGTTFEYAIPISYFTSAIAGLTYDPDLDGFPSAGGAITLRLSQSFSYSVAGGGAYGNDRLGRVTLVGPSVVPEPESIALLGIGAVVFAAARRRRAVAAR